MSTSLMIRLRYSPVLTALRTIAFSLEVPSNLKKSLFIIRAAVHMIYRPLTSGHDQTLQFMPC